LRALSLFEELSREELEFMVRFKVAHRHSARGTILIRDGEGDGLLCTLFSGWALQHRRLSVDRRQITKILLPGDLIGLDAVFIEQPQYSIQAASDITYCVLDKRLLAEMPVAQPALDRRLTRIALTEQRDIEAWLTVIGRCSAEERIAYLILDLHSRLSRRRLIHSDGFTLPLTQQQIADAVGLNIIHTNKILRRLRSVFTIQKHRVTIHNIAALRRLTAFSPEEGKRPLL
jgi:CRP-like cAMP-binding protein